MKLFGGIPCFFPLEKKRKSLNFPSVLALRNSLVGSFYETRAPTSRKYVNEQGIFMPNRSKIYQKFWLHPSVLDLEKQPENLIFHSALTSKRPFGGNFQKYTCTYFQKVVI